MPEFNPPISAIEPDFVKGSKNFGPALSYLFYYLIDKYSEALTQSEKLA
jgi:hypothetical protein